MKSKRKTLTGQDVLAAMEDMEFEKFVEPLKESLEVFRKELKGKKEASEIRKKNKMATATEQIPGDVGKPGEEESEEEVENVDEDAAKESGEDENEESEDENT